MFEAKKWRDERESKPTTIDTFLSTYRIRNIRSEKQRVKRGLNPPQPTPSAMLPL
jgi:hypothetical protein